MNKQKGFTLIELIIVIVILGILAVTAAPRFIDLQSDAKASTLQGVKAALQGASQLVYAKAAINGKLDGTDSVNIGSATNVKNVSIVNGYPNALVIEAVADVTDFLDLDDTDFSVINAATPVNNFIITLGTEVESNNCFIRYTNADADEAPLIEITESGC